MGQAIRKVTLPRVDHLGNEFPTGRALCAYWHVDPGTLRTRLSYDWPLDAAITGKREESSVADHTGTKFSSMAEMAAHWGISSRTLQSRLNANWTLDRALTEPVAKKSKEFRDHEGAPYPTRAAMLDKWGVTQECFDGRIARGWSLERALTEPVRKPVPIKTPDGTEYPDMKSFCDANGISDTTYRKRLAEGIAPGEMADNDFVEDHTGRRFRTLADMAARWGVPKERLYARLKSNWPLERALTEKSNWAERPTTDHEGRAFNSAAAMCAYWSIGVSTLDARLRQGWGMAQILTELVPNHKIDDSLTVVRKIDGPYYLVRIDGRDDIWTHNRIMAHLHPERAVMKTERTEEA